MIKVALYLKKKLEGGILEKAFNSDPVRNFIDDFWFSCKFAKLLVVEVKYNILVSFD